MVDIIIPNKKEPVLSLILSLFIPGLGHIYTGHIKKGIVLFVAFVISILLAYVAWAHFVGFFIMLIPIAIWLYCIFDAVGEAGKVNRGEPSKDWLQ